MLSSLMAQLHQEKYKVFMAGFGDFKKRKKKLKFLKP
jgi:hypothetical protein